jgi:metal-dependent hydrolase (beta-lactamase superfamily II)
MKLSVLAENTASGYYTAEHGLSYFIEYEFKIKQVTTGMIFNF